MKNHRILFICHGNICRSPMAEFILKDMVEKAGRAGEFEIASAATWPTLGTLGILRRRLMTLSKGVGDFSTPLRSARNESGVLNFSKKSLFVSIKIVILHSILI